jgi:hypothetical protein
MDASAAQVLGLFPFTVEHIYLLRRDDFTIHDSGFYFCLEPEA